MPIGFKKNKTNVPENSEDETNDVIDDLRDQDEEPVRAPHLDVKVMVLAITLIIIIICLVFWKISGSTDSNGDTSDATVSTDVGDVSSDAGLAEGQQVSQDVSNDESVGNGVYDENGDTIDPNGINPGVPDYEHSNNNITTAKVFDADDFVKDINGLDVAAVYHEASLEYVIDYVSYEAHRGITDTGMELYWLDVDYNGLKYRVQVPFYYFKDLKEKGVCRVEIEIVHTVDGGKIISYMHVVSEDYTGD